MLLGQIALATPERLPEFQSLHLGLATQYQKSDSNFATDGAATDFLNSGQPSSFREMSLGLIADYGFARDWSAKFNLNFVSGFVDSQTGSGTFHSGAGISQVGLGVKWRLMQRTPNIILENAILFPGGGDTPKATGDLVLQEGGTQYLLALHTGYRINQLIFYLSPAFRARFGGYSSRVELHSGLQISLLPVYINLFSDLKLSLSESAFPDSSLFVHDVSGAGGSYARLTGSPSNFNLGAMVSMRLGRQFYPGIYFAQTLWGIRAPNGYQAGVKLNINLDFFNPVEKTRLKEVPLEGDNSVNLY